MKKTMLNGLILLFISCLLGSCASLWPFDDAKKEVAEATPPQHSEAPVVDTSRQAETTVGESKQPSIAQSKSTSSQETLLSRNQVADDEMALKFSRVLSRLDDVESELRRQREKIRLLEQGLLTGIAPDDLKNQKRDAKAVDRDEVPQKKSHVRENLSKPVASNGDGQLMKPKLEDLSMPDRLNHDESAGDSPVLAKIQIAKEHYQAGRFGLAIAELAGVSREYGDAVQDGAVKVWLGKSYLGLKEYQTARGEFESYIKNWPMGGYIATCRLDLARAYVGLGLRERARSELRKVVKDFEGEDYGEMASAELKNIQGSL